MEARAVRKSLLGKVVSKPRRSEHACEGYGQPVPAHVGPETCCYSRLGATDYSLSQRPGSSMRTTITLLGAMTLVMPLFGPLAAQSKPARPEPGCAQAARKVV